MASEELEKQIQALREDYARAEGRPFQHFCCPFRCRDDPAHLCKGHVVNAAMPNSCRAWVPQRRDVDSFFGTMFEADYGFPCDAFGCPRRAPTTRITLWTVSSRWKTC